MPINDRKGGRLPPLAEVVEFDFAPMLDQVGRLDESFQRIARSASRLLDALRGVNTELSTIVPAVERLRFGELTVTAREETSRDVAERLRRRGTVEGVTGADSSTILGRAISFGIGGTLRDIVTSPFRFGANVAQTSLGQAGARLAPWIGAIGLARENYRFHPDALLGSQDILSYLSFRHGASLIDPGGIGGVARRFGYGSLLPLWGGAELARSGIQTGLFGSPFTENLRNTGTYRGFYGLTSPFGLTPEAVDRFGYSLFRGETPGLSYQERLRRARGEQTLPPVVVRPPLEPTTEERFALRGGASEEDAFRIRRLGTREGIEDLKQAVKEGNVEAFQEAGEFAAEYGQRLQRGFRASVADVNLTTGQVTLGGLGRGSLFAASQFSPGSLGAQVGQFGRAGRIFGEAARFDPEFGTLARGAAGLETQGRGIISQLPTWERLREEAAALHTDIEGLEDASRAFGQAGASAVRNLITDFNSLGDTFKGLITLVAELVLQVAVFTPLQNALSSAFSVGYGAIAGGGGSVPGAVNSTGGWIPPGGSSVVINNNYEGVSRSQAVELAATSRAQSVDDVRRAQSQITSPLFDGKI